MTRRITGAAQVASAPRSRSGPSGATLTEERRAELGYGRLSLRLPLDALEMLRVESESSGYSRAELIDSAVRLYVGSDELARDLRIKKKLQKR